MPEIALPTKITQDAIKQDTTLILDTLNSNLGSDTLTIANSTNSTTPVDFINITGKGILKHLSAMATTSNYIAVIEVYVDGELILKSKGNYTSPIGIFNINYMSQGVNGESAKPLINNNGNLSHEFGTNFNSLAFNKMVSLPYTVGENDKFAITTEGILFNESLVVKTYSTNTGYTNWLLGIVDIL